MDDTMSIPNDIGTAVGELGSDVLGSVGCVGRVDDDGRGTLDSGGVNIKFRSRRGVSRPVGVRIGTQDRDSDGGHGVIRV